MANTQRVQEEIKVKGNQLVDRVRSIIEEGNARRISIRKDGRTLMELPLSVGVGGAAAAVLIAPMLAAVGAVAALVSDVDVLVERDPAKELEKLTDDLASPGPPTPGATGMSSPTDKSIGNPTMGTPPDDPAL